MRRPQLLIALSTACVVSGCIDWDDAELGWCNIADVENRHAVCDLGDGTVAGPAPAVQHPRIFSAPGNQRLQSLASVGGEVFVAGEFDTELRFGGTFPSNGKNDGFVARLDADGNPAQTITFGGFEEDQVLQLREGPGGTLMLAGRFTATATAPGGTSLSSNGLRDSYVALLDASLQPVRMRDFGATAGSEVDLMNVSWSQGAIVVSGRVSGTMVVDGVQIGQGGTAQAFALVLDEQLAYQWHAVTTDCVDGYGDAAVLGPEGELYWTVRIQSSGDGAMCQLGNQPAFGNFWHDALIRLDRVEGELQTTWVNGFHFSSKNPFPFKGKMHEGYEAPHSLEFRDGEVVWLRHLPGQTQALDPFARVEFLSPENASPIREHRQAGSLVSDGNVRARFAHASDGLYMFGNFASDALNFGGSALGLGPVREGQHGFVRRFGSTEEGDWARALLGRASPNGANVVGVHVDAQNRTWMAGSFEDQIVTSEIWLDGEDKDIFLFVTEPQQP